MYIYIYIYIVLPHLRSPPDHSRPTAESNISYYYFVLLLLLVVVVVVVGVIIIIIIIIIISIIINIRIMCTNNKQLGGASPQPVGPLPPRSGEAPPLLRL